MRKTLRRMLVAAAITVLLSAALIVYRVVQRRSEASPGNGTILIFAEGITEHGRTES
ncbi:MAG: hypothetical protein ACI4NF_05305 [Christensenellales bacterium]